MLDLRPCPFCNSDDIRIDRNVIPDEWPPMTNFMAFCATGCAAWGPPGDSQAQAITLWNNRPGQAHTAYQLFTLAGQAVSMVD